MDLVLSYVILSLGSSSHVWDRVHVRRITRYVVALVYDDKGSTGSGIIYTIHYYYCPLSEDLTLIYFILSFPMFPRP